jgi:hypothetical protein
MFNYSHPILMYCSEQHFLHLIAFYMYWIIWTVGSIRSNRHCSIYLISILNRINYITQCFDKLQVKSAKLKSLFYSFQLLTTYEGLSRSILQVSICNSLSIYSRLAIKAINFYSITDCGYIQKLRNKV